jgi:hypothetical protein
MRILALLPGMVWLAAVETSARGDTTTAAAVVYERLLADRNTSCLLLFPGPEESAVCEQTRDCLDYFSRQLDFATFTSLCDVIQAPAAAGGEQDARPAGEDKRPGPAEVRPFSHRSSLMFGKMLRKFRCCGSGMYFQDPTLFHPGSEFFPSRIRIKKFKYINPKKWFLSSRKHYPGCSSRIRFPDRNMTFYLSRISDLGV